MYHSQYSRKHFGDYCRIETIHMGHRSSYPDRCVRIDGQIFYIEIKTTTKSVDHSSEFRVFYFQSIRKLKYDGIHILIQLFVEPIPNKENTFKFKNWRIKDLYYLDLRLREEYNAGYNTLRQLSTLASN